MGLHLDKAQWCLQWSAISQEPLGLMMALHGYIKAKEYEVILRTRCSLWCQHCSLVMLLYSKTIMFPHWETHSKVIPWSSGWRQMASITSSISRSEHHWAFMGYPGVQSAKWISTSFIPQSFPSSMKGKHPITYSPELVRQHSMWDRNSSEGWSYYLIRHLMFKHY